MLMVMSLQSALSMLRLLSAFVQPSVFFSLIVFILASLFSLPVCRIILACDLYLKLVDFHTISAAYSLSDDQVFFSLSHSLFFFPCTPQFLWGKPKEFFSSKTHYLCCCLVHNYSRVWHGRLITTTIIKKMNTTSVSDCHHVWECLFKAIH